MLDLRVHPAGLSDQDFATMREFGIDGVVLVADGSATSHADRLLAHFDALLSHHAPRLERAGLRVACALGVHPRAVPRRGLLKVLEALPGLCGRRVVALGLIGLARGGPEEEEAFVEQLRIARRLGLPVLVTTPSAERERHTRRVLTLLQSSKMPGDKVLVDGASPRTVKTIKALGFYAGLSLRPDSLSVERAVALVRSLGPQRLILDTGAGDGSSDMLALARAEHRLLRAGLTKGVVARVTGRNAASLLSLDWADAR